MTLRFYRATTSKTQQIYSGVTFRKIRFRGNEILRSQRKRGPFTIPRRQRRHVMSCL